MEYFCLVDVIKGVENIFRSSLWIGIICRGKVEGLNGDLWLC